MSAEEAAGSAEKLIGKVQKFIETLDEDERALFAVLIGPGVEALQADEVAGFAQSTTWEPGSLRAQLAAAAETSGMQVIYNPD